MEHEEKDDLVGKLQRNVQVLKENVDKANEEKVLQKKVSIISSFNMCALYIDFTYCSNLVMTTTLSISSLLL